MENKAGSTTAYLYNSLNILNICGDIHILNDYWFINVDPLISSNYFMSVKINWECLKLFAGALRRQTSKRGSVATCLRKTKAWNPSGTLPLSNRWGIYFKTQKHFETKFDIIQWRTKCIVEEMPFSTEWHLWDEVWQNPIMESNGATVVPNVFLRTFHSNYVCPKAIYISP